MSDDWRRYDDSIDLSVDDDSRVQVLRSVERHPGLDDILELGCSTGRTSEVLRHWGRRVVGIEFDATAAAEARQHADEVIVGDLDDRDTLGRLGDRTFDMVLAADVLEHLRDPLGCLRDAVTRLRPGGVVVLSIPNVAHGDIRLALLEGRFEYTDVGLLDRTHISLFTIQSLRALITDAGLVAVNWHRIRRIMGNTEVRRGSSALDWARMVLDGDPEAMTYQWVVECRRASEAHAAVDDFAHEPAPLLDRVQHVARFMAPPPQQPGVRAAVRQLLAAVFGRGGRRNTPS